MHKYSFSRLYVYAPKMNKNFFKKPLTFTAIYDTIGLPMREMKINPTAERILKK
jgi:hypothetical protein